MELNELKAWRKEAFGSQDALATRLGRDQHAISRYERGLTQIPEDIAQQLRELGYKGPLEAQAEQRNSGGLVDDLNVIEVAVEQIAKRGFNPPNKQAEKDMRRLVARIWEQARGDRDDLVDQVEQVLRLARATQK